MQKISVADAGRLLLRFGSLLPGLLFFANAAIRINLCDMVHYKTTELPLTAAWPTAVALPAAAAAALLLKRTRDTALLLPGLLYWGLLPFFRSCTALMIGIALAGWIVFRLAAERGVAPKNHSDAASPAPVLAAGLALICAVWNFYIQNHSFHTLLLSYNDWGEYFENYLRIASGGLGAYTPVTAGHWNPLPTAVMTLLIRLAPAPETVFAANALLIASVVPLIYALARRCGLPPSTALCFAFLAAINPTISNQPLSLFYGFHPVNFMIPMLPGFFLAQTARRPKTAAAIAAATFLVQETAAIFWAGYALTLLCRRKYGRGALLFGFCVLFFLFISSVVIPHFTSTAVYSQMFHYRQLGDTPLLAALSPFLRPEAFWRTVFERQNFAFTAALLLPLLFPVLAFPFLLVAALPLLAGVCLQSSPHVKNIIMQYGLEITLLLLVMAVRNTARLREGEPSPVLRFPALGTAGRSLHAAATAAALTTACCCYFFFGKSIALGKYSFSAAAAIPPADASIRRLKAAVPPGSRVLATPTLRCHFLASHPTFPLGGEPVKTGDFLCFDLYDNRHVSADFEALRRELAFRPDVRPVATESCNARQLVLFRVVPPGTPETPTPSLERAAPPEGIPLPCSDPHFSLRAGPAPDGRLRIQLKVLAVPEYDAELWVLTADEERVQRIPFAWGLKPAYAARIGDLFVCESELPSQEVTGIAVIPRPEPGSAATP